MKIIVNFGDDILLHITTYVKGASKLGVSKPQPAETFMNYMYIYIL
jgi:hypothetical protein